MPHRQSLLREGRVFHCKVPFPLNCISLKKTLQWVKSRTRMLNAFYVYLLALKTLKKKETNSSFFRKTKNRSSRPEVLCKKGVLWNFAKFTRKHLSQCLFLRKVAGLKPAVKKRLCQRCFPENFVISLTTSFFTKHLRWLLLLKQQTTNSKINSNYLGDKLFLKNVYVIKVLAHWCVQRTGG